jgi:Holliday junction resolvase RusA-like endonuclease
MEGRALFEGPLILTISIYRSRPKGHYGTGRNEGCLRMSAPFYPTTQPDTTKLVRGIEDAMTGVVYRDDAQIVHQKARKSYTTGSAYVEVAVEELPDD